MKATLPLLLLFLCSAFFPCRASAATLQLQGRILGLSTPTNPELSTLDFYFITALSDTTVSITHIVTAPPAPTGTGLDLKIFLPPSPDDPEELPRVGGVLGNASGTANLFAGHRYIVSLSPRNSDFDGYWPLPAVENNDSAFAWFDYHSSITGDVRLDEIWRGRADGTFEVTIVPEPGGAVLLGAASLALVLGGRRRAGPARTARSVLLLLAVGCTMAHAEQGVLRWQSTEGMGYRLQRSGILGGTQTPWINLPVEYYGTGGPIMHSCFQLEPPQAATGGAALQQVMPVRMVTIRVRKDGSAVLRWTQNGKAVAHYAAPPPEGTSTGDAGAPPWVDFRATPGLPYDSTSNPLLSGGPVLPAVPPEGANPAYPVSPHRPDDTGPAPGHTGGANPASAHRPGGGLVSGVSRPGR